VSYTLSLYTGCGDKNRANSGNGISGQNLSLCRTLPLQERGQRTLLFSFWPSRVSCLENDHVTAARLQLADHSSIRWALASSGKLCSFHSEGPSTPSGRVIPALMPSPLRAYFTTTSPGRGCATVPSAVWSSPRCALQACDSERISSGTAIVVSPIWRSPARVRVVRHSGLAQPTGSAWSRVASQAWAAASSASRCAA
jgi:hypothetical protein